MPKAAGSALKPTPCSASSLLELSLLHGRLSNLRASLRGLLGAYLCAADLRANLRCFRSVRSLRQYPRQSPRPSPWTLRRGGTA
mmetsp:Transcript_47353/g.94458  ORF Transcript_47353/g.94458 Transcript_47353/m.94458 type:complete len:84 (-) Transcript_47353:1340-1591(-)